MVIIAMMLTRGLGVLFLSPSSLHGVGSIYLRQKLQQL
jgi:hypothetical protein